MDRVNASAMKYRSGATRSTTQARNKSHRFWIEIIIVRSFNWLFWSRSDRAGGIAQLVERQLCKLDVVGSNPSTSTNFKGV